MRDSVQSTENQKASIEQHQEVSGKTDYIGSWTPDDACYALAESLSVYMCSETLAESQIKGSKLMNLAGETSRQSSIETVAWLLLRAFSQIYEENQEQRDLKNDLKCWEFGQKGSFSKSVTFKCRAEKIVIAEK